MAEEIPLTMHDREVKELFESVSVELPGSDELRVLNYKAFKTAIDKKMDEAYYYGQLSALGKARDIVDEAFNK